MTGSARVTFRPSQFDSREIRVVIVLPTCESDFGRIRYMVLTRELVLPESGLQKYWQRWLTPSPGAQYGLENAASTRVQERRHPKGACRVACRQDRQHTPTAAASAASTGSHASTK